MMRYLLTLIFFFIFSSFAYAADFVVVVSSDGPLVEATDTDLRAIYLGEKRFEGEVRYTPINFIEGELKDAFLESVLDMNSKEYKLYWVKKVFQEGLTLPRTMGDVRAAVEFIKGEKGAVAYLPESYVHKLKGEEGITVLSR